MSAPVRRQPSPAPAPARTCGRSGHTLAELMVVLAVAAVLLAVGVPSLADFLRRQQLRSTASDLFSAINLTRSQAMARGHRVLMVPADSAGLDWGQGWFVFVDGNANRRYDAGEELIFQQGPVARGIVISAAFSASAGAPYIAYNGAGRSCGAENSAAAHFGSLSLVLATHVRHIKINMLGRVRICDPQVEKSTCSGAAAS